MKRQHLLRILYIALAVGLVAGSYFAGRAIAPTKVANAEEDFGVGALAAPNASTFHCATITGVAAFNNRVHLRCGTVNTVGTSSVIYYVYATDPAHATTANEILAIGNTAFALGKPVDLFYNANSSLNPSGCNTGDCRGLVGVEMRP